MGWFSKSDKPKWSRWIPERYRRTVRFYNGYPRYNIMAGDEGKVLARQIDYTVFPYSSMAYTYLVELNDSEVIEISSQLVRVSFPKTQEEIPEKD